MFNSKGEIVTDPRDAGTYNYAPSSDYKKMRDFPSAYYQHYKKDILPYIFWGNTPEDAQLTTQRQRIKALLGWY